MVQDPLQTPGGRRHLAAIAGFRHSLPMAPGERWLYVHASSVAVAYGIDGSTSEVFRRGGW